MLHLVRNISLALSIFTAVPVVAADEFPLPLGFVSDYQTINGTKLHFVKGGSGPLVFLVHGFGQTWYEWHQLMPELAKNYTVVAPDLPGLGQSEVAKSYRGKDVAQTLYKLAKSQAGNRKFDLVAHDIGIWNTYPMAVEHQSEIRKLVYMEAPIPDDSIYSFPAFTPEGESLVWHFSFFAAGNRLAETLITGKEGIFFEHFIKEHATNKSVFTPELLGLYATSYSKPHSLNAAFEYYRALTQTAADNKEISQNKLEMPVLAIGGGGHGGFGEFEATLVRKYATNVVGKVLPDCGHWLPEECAAPLNEAVTNFLNAE